MAPRKEPASIVVEFFEAAPLDTARTVLAIVKGIVARKSPPKLRQVRKPIARPTEDVAANSNR